jgi:branched-chain amino acid transport system permease protein
MPLLAAFFAGGLVAALFGVFTGLPSARIKGFYLVVCTLALQFFVEWLFTRFRWFSNDNASGLVSVPRLTVAGYDLSSPVARYLLTLTVVSALTLLAIGIVRSELGRLWVAVRDMDTAAAVIGIPVLRSKLWAFAVSSFYCGVAGALWGFCYLGTFDPRTWELSRSFQVLFIVIIGGLGSIRGSFLGAAFILLLPILMSHLGQTLFAGALDQGTLENYKKIVFGGLIVFFLIKEPLGLARLWKRLRGRARVWRLREWWSP